MNKYQIKGTSGDVTGKKWPLNESVTVGSEPDCDVVLSGELIAPQHARFDTSDVVVTLQAVHGDVFVNGEKIKLAALGSGDEIRFGNYRFMLQAPGLRPQRVLQPEAVNKKSRAGLWAILFAAAITGAGFAAWQQGLLPF
ncbi:MAG: FHA domain-containing protein [Xanthomonadales bacterium]|nr:FHA domain-containing protein [Xanthomonadales bacterium]